MVQDDRDIYVKNIFSKIAPYIDFLNSFFTFGKDKLWRKNLIAMSGIKSGDMVLDICTGTGDVAFLISEKVGPHGEVIGIDFCEEMLEIANKRKNNQHRNISFMLSNAKDLDFPDNSFDAVTVAFGIRNIPETIRALKEIKRVLRPGGRFICLELTRPTNRFFVPFYKVYTFKVMPFIAKIFLRTETPYNYLPRSIEAYYKPEDFKELMTRCGFSDITVRPMTGGIVTLYINVSNS